MKKLNCSIDCLGIMHTRSVLEVLKKYTNQIGNLYLCRNEIYYNSKPLNVVLKIREELKSYLGADKTMNYIIFDYAINFSAQVYYYLKLIDAEKELVEQAANCLQEDVNNMVNLIENKNHFSRQYALPQSDLLINFRNIELDNKLEIYSYVKGFGKSNYTFITPGLGSILIGPFFKAIWGNNFEHIMYSRFKDKNLKNFKAPKISNNNLYLIDDNVGSGFTTQELMQLFKNKLKGAAAVEYDWFLYDVISKGDSPYTKFNFELYDKITLLNTRNHRFLDGAVEILKEQPVEYCKFLKQNNFNHGPTNDLNLLFKVGKKIAKHYLPNQVYKNSLNLTKKILKIYEGM